VDLLIHDELGFIALGELLFDQFSERNETRSTLLTTNLSFGEWVQVFGDEKRTIALLDRLGRHAHVLTTRGESYRTRKRRRKQEPKVAPQTSMPPDCQSRPGGSVNVDASDPFFSVANTADRGHLAAVCYGTENCLTVWSLPTPHKTCPARTC
jgi:hypothetical protein